MASHLRNQRGQAMTETILLTWILLVFVAAIYQLFLVNQSVYASLTAVHTRLFERGFERNCHESSPECRYSTDDEGGAARVIWTPTTIPEVEIPVVGLFAEAMPPNLRLESRRYGVGGYDDDCPGRPCKRTKMGSGTYKNPLAALAELPGIVVDEAYLSGMLDDLDMYLLQAVLNGLIDSLF